MPRTKAPTEIKTTIVDGDYDSFKAAISRSILGVTIKKNKSKGAKFYQARGFNLALVDNLCYDFHQNLQQQLGSLPLKDLKVRTILRINWDEIGRVNQISDVRFDIYNQIGEMNIPKPEITAGRQSIRVDFFYSTYDAASQIILKEIKELKKNEGDFLQIRLYDIQKLTSEGEKKKKAHKVELVPTVIINDEDVIVNPSRASLKSRLNKAFNPSVTLHDSKFSWESSLRTIIEKLSTQSGLSKITKG